MLNAAARLIGLYSVADSLKNLSNNDTSMKYSGYKGQMMMYPKKHLDIKNSIWRLKSKMAANNNQNALKSL